MSAVAIAALLLATGASARLAPADSTNATTLLARALLAPQAHDSTNAASAAGGGWSKGRATHYGGSGDKWSLDTGSCMMQIDSQKLVTAVNVAGRGNTDKCGQCFEVMCVDGPTRGLPSSRFGAESVCYLSGRKSVVVQVTDSCPCDYPANANSNREWCCGDVPHFDLSWAAFGHMAPMAKGVMDLAFRPVDCSSRKNSITTY